MRQVEMADLEQLIAIENDGFTPEEAASRQAFIERIAVITDSFIVAEEAGVILGYVNGPVINQAYITDDLFETISANPPTAGYQSILGLAVAKSARGKGIARLLMTRLFELAQEHERIGMTLTCKEELISFYEGLGYTNHGLSDSTLGGVRWYNMMKRV